MGDVEDMEKLAAVWPLLQEMRESGDFCCIDLRSEYDFAWDIVAVRTIIPEHERKSISTITESLAEAILSAYSWWKSDWSEEERPESNVSTMS